MNILLLAIIVERITEIITSSEISDIIFKNRLKRHLFSGDKPSGSAFRSVLLFIDKITSCGYCCSVWVAGVISTVESAYFDNVFLDAMLLHGLSNLYHVLYELTRRGRINSYDIKCTMANEVAGEKYE
jgi:hypothetical protein